MVLISFVGDDAFIVPYGDGGEQWLAVFGAEGDEICPGGAVIEGFQAGAFAFCLPGH